MSEDLTEWTGLANLIDRGNRVILRGELALAVGDVAEGANAARLGDIDAAAAALDALDRRVSEARRLIGEITRTAGSAQ